MSTEIFEKMFIGEEVILEKPVPQNQILVTDTESDDNGSD